MDIGLYKVGTKRRLNGVSRWKKYFKIFFRRGNFTPFMSKIFQILDHFFPLLFPKGSKNQKSLDIRLWEVGAKRPLNGVRNNDTKKSCSVRQNLPKNKLFLRVDFAPLISKSFKIWDHFLSLLFSKDFESLQILDIWF